GARRGQDLLRVVLAVLDVVDRRADVAGAAVRPARGEARLDETDVPRIVEVDPVRSRQRVAVQEALGDRVVLRPEPGLQDAERLRLADVGDALDVVDVPDLIPELSDLRLVRRV